MYKLTPPRLFLLEELKADPDAMARVERIVRGVGRTMDDVATFRVEDTPDVERQVAEAAETEGGAELGRRPRRRSLIFTKIAIDDRDAVQARLASACSGGEPSKHLGQAAGLLPLSRTTHARERDAEDDMVCWTTEDLGLMYGCPHGCQYCNRGKYAESIVVGANVGEYMDKVLRRVIEETPDQKCFRLIGWLADIVTFEPEYGAFASFLETLSDYEGRYGYFHTGSDNIDWIADLPHRDRLIGVWSLTCDSGARYIEPGTPPLAARVEAGRKCKEWGLPIRFKFKPVVPVRGWREEYAEAIDLIFRTARPESLGFCMIMWMPLDALAEKIPLDRLDPEFVDAARREADRLREVRTGPFPPEVRAEVYRHFIREIRARDKDIPIYLSTESREMWDELKDELGQSPGKFLCGCNPIQTPGPVLEPSGSLTRSTY